MYDNPTTFVWSKGSSVESMKKILSHIMLGVGAIGRPDDYFYIYIGLNDSGEENLRTEILHRYDLRKLLNIDEIEDLDEADYKIYDFISDLTDEKLFEFLEKYNIYLGGYDYEVDNCCYFKLNVVPKNSRTDIMKEIVKLLNITIASKRY